MDKLSYDLIDQYRVVNAMHLCHDRAEYGFGHSALDQ